jgi:hypothetical protein
VSEERGNNDETFREPSWPTALAEADAVSRRLRQATDSMEGLSRELQVLREWRDTAARLEVAQSLMEGLDGGVLNSLVSASSDEAADPGSRRTARDLLERLTSALGLEPVGERGEYLKLLPEELGEFEVRGRPGAAPLEGHRELYCVMRPGWWLGEHIVVRPLLEPVEPAHAPDGSPALRLTR